MTEMYALCYARDEPAGALTVQDILCYDLERLSPQPGPVIARWIARWGRQPGFRVVVRKRQSARDVLPWPRIGRG